MVIKKTDIPEVLAVIPARGGSRGVPKKNITKLGGVPLIGYSIKVANESKFITRTIVSTDDLEIAEIAKSYGAEIPFIRPSEFAQDDTPDLPVFQHAVNYLRENENYMPEVIIHIRPTSPLAFRRLIKNRVNEKENWIYINRAEEIDKAVSELISVKEADSVRSVNIPEDTPFKMWKTKGDWLIPFVESKEKDIYNVPRQYLPIVYRQNGYVDVTRCVTIIERQSMTGDRIKRHFIDSDYFVDIDTPLHLEFAEFFLEKIRFDFNSIY